eukprot:scaffold1534_cov391-Prasinococcus_capsulatus_cf.AAC.9
MCVYAQGCLTLHVQQEAKLPQAPQRAQHGNTLGASISSTIASKPCPAATSTMVTFASRFFPNVPTILWAASHVSKSSLRGRQSALQATRPVATSKCRMRARASVYLARIEATERNRTNFIEERVATKVCEVRVAKPVPTP